MAPLQITCNGESTIYHPAERAVVFITVSSDGPSQSQVSQEVTLTSDQLQVSLKTMALKDPTGQAAPNAPVTHWSMTSLSTGSWQPTDNRGKNLARRFTASSRLEVKFRDFAQLGTFTSELAQTKFVSVDRIEWRLTDATKAELGRQCRRNAVKDAMAKAKDYADAAGKADFEILEITDGVASSGYIPPYRRMFSAAPGAGGDGQELNFEPEDVSISSSLTAKFDAA